MVSAANLGFPRIGAKRQLKTAVEAYWSGKIEQDDLIAMGRQLRIEAWSFQRDAGIDYIPSNDFSFYDHVLDTVAMVGAVPSRFKAISEQDGSGVGVDTYFAMARGTSRGVTAPAMEMTKWFNTNYHFMVPELEPDQKFALASTKCIDEFNEARNAGILTRPVLLSPITFVSLSKLQRRKEESKILERLVEVYSDVLLRLKDVGAECVQIDEPILSMDLHDFDIGLFDRVYGKLASVGLPLDLTTYFGPMRDNLPFALNLPVRSLHVDLIYGAKDLRPALRNWPSHMHFSAGVVDGRNVWKCNLEKTSELLGSIAEEVGVERLIIAPSCSLLHVPVDVAQEDEIVPEVRSWLAFAKQKLEEISILTDDLCCGRVDVEHAFADNATSLKGREVSLLRNDAEVQTRVAAVNERMWTRDSAYPIRGEVQRKRFSLPPLPTTTIGSFPQTPAIREARKNWRAGKISQTEYSESMRNEIANNISIQEKIGIDVFVHGEPERTDMVEYFADQLQGIAVTKHGWVQSYGSRCVKPPIIYGDVSRPEAMTVEWITFAQSLTGRPVKGMLTGPVTMLQWSFVRDDQPREVTCAQLALAVRDEVSDLESAGIHIIQIDEPAIREGLPLRRDEWLKYLEWAVRCFRLSSSSVADTTQIHTHMCYSEFGDMLQSIADMDADVISIEAARSQMDLLISLSEIRYPNEIGPGVYDIHSPRIPSVSEMESLLQKALKVIPAERLWVNPDCGLKTRTWNEVEPALKAMVEVAVSLRSKTVVTTS